MKPPADINMLFESDEIQFQSEDEALAMALLDGLFRWSRSGKVTHYHLSSKTNPTEQEGRAALARILRRGNPPQWLLDCLADLFVPDRLAKYRNSLTADLKRVGNNRGNIRIDRIIAGLVDAIRADGLSYEQATAQVAETQGVDLRNVQKIYDRFKRIARQVGREDLAD